MTDWIIIGGGVLLVLAIAGVVVWKMTSGEFVMDLIEAAADRLWNKLGPKIIAKVMKRMPPDEEEAWNIFKRSNPDKYEIRRWQRDYARRQKMRENAAKVPPV